MMWLMVEAAGIALLAMLALGALCSLFLPRDDELDQSDEELLRLRPFRGC